MTKMQIVESIWFIGFMTVYAFGVFKILIEELIGVE